MKQKREAKPIPIIEDFFLFTLLIKNSVAMYDIA